MIANSLEPHVVAMPLTPEWYAARKTGFGASEAAAICGLSEYDTPLHIYLRHRGELEPVEETAPMRLGTKLEPVVVSEFIHQTGMELTLYPCPMYRHPLPELTFMLATPDAQLSDCNLLEAKTTSWRTAKLLGEEGTDFIPERWVMQCQHQMEVTGTDLVHVAVLIDGRTLRGYQVVRNDHLIARMIEIERELWERIRDGNPPEPTWGNATTTDLIKQMHGLTTGKTIILSADVATLWNVQDGIGQQERAAKKSRDEVRSRILHAMGDAEIALFETGPDGPNDLQLIRKQCDRAGYSVGPTSYVTLTELKQSKSKRKR